MKKKWCRKWDGILPNRVTIQWELYRDMVYCIAIHMCIVIEAWVGLLAERVNRYTQLYRDRLRLDRQRKCVTIQILYRDRLRLAWMGNGSQYNKCIVT